MSDDQTQSEHVRAWQQAAQLFDRLATVEPEQREQLLSSTPLASEARGWLDRLLAAHDRVQTALVDRQITELVERLMPGANSEYDAEAFYQRRFGPWMALGEIGRGGMGLVLHGQRADGQFEKQVAIKLLDPALLGPKLEQQIQQELRILASLQHPGIAQLLDGGISQDGLPYLVMEYIDGQSIQRYCEDQKLSMEQRLELFYKVAEAVDYCHRQLVIHGDIKPDNVLVDLEGRVKLLDFGIASRLAESADAEKQSSMRWCSPAYAAPERLAGAVPAVAEDVFALGALLYELVSGGRIRSTSDLTRVVVGQTTPETAPRRASDIAAAKGLSARHVRRVQGGLDDILSTALASAPEQRYATVQALMDDCSRWQQHYPIQARPATLADQAGKWLRRNRLLAVSASLVVLALVGGLAVSLWQADRAQQAAMLAEQNAERASAAQGEAEQALERADQINEFLLGLFRARFPNLPPDELPTTRQILDQGIAQARDPDTGAPALRADLMLSLTEILAARSQLDEADAMLDEVAQIVVLDENVPLAIRHSALKGDLSNRRNQHDQTEHYLRKSIVLYFEHKPEDIKRLELQRDLAQMMMRREQWPAAEQILDQVLIEARQREDADRLQLAIAGDLAAIAGRTGQLDRALERFAELLSMKQAMGHSPTSIATTEVNMAGLERTLHRYDESSARFQVVLEHLQPYTDVPRPVRATAMKGLSDIAFVRGEFDRANDWLQKSADEWVRLLDLPSAEDDFFLFYYRAPILAGSGRYLEAADDLQNALERMLGSQEPPPGRIEILKAERARYLCRVGDFEQAHLVLAQAEAAYQHLAEVEFQVQFANVVCRLERASQTPDPAWLPTSTIEHALKSSGDLSLVAELELLRAELLMQSGQTDQAMALIDRAEQRLQQAEALDTHPLRVTVNRLRSTL